MREAQEKTAGVKRKEQQEEASFDDRPHLNGGLRLASQMRTKSLGHHFFSASESVESGEVRPRIIKSPPDQDV